MQPRTKEMPTAVNRSRKTTSNFDQDTNSNPGSAGRASSEPGNSTNRQRTQSQNVSREISNDEIARRAYIHWESEGKPDGKDLDHWLRAKAELEQSRP